MRIELDNPVTIVVQPEITNEITAYTLIRFEDDGETIRALTDLGYVTLFTGSAYPVGGIFGLDRKDTIDLVTNEIEKL
jgi:hypothetical protein